MAHILCITSGLTGILHASFELVSRLEAAGHRVTYLSPSPVREAVEAQGFEFEQLPAFQANPAPPGPSYAGPTARFRNLVGRWTSREARLQAGIEALEMENHARIIGSLQPDLVIADMEVHESILAAYALGLPLLLLTPFFSTWRRPGLPPLTSGITPGQGLRGSRWGIAWAWFRSRLKRRRRALKQRIRGAVSRGDVLIHYGKNVGFPTRELDRYTFPTPFVYRTLPVISMTLQALEFPHRPRPGLHYLGPMVFARRGSAVFTRSDDEVFARRDDAHRPIEVEERARAIAAQSRVEGKPLIYCTVSTMYRGDTAFLQNLVKALVRRQDWTLVIGMGGNTDTAFLGTLPPNVHVFDWAPQLFFLSVASCSVHAGGINTINECIHFGVPMLIYSGGRNDQGACAARVAYHGLGIRGDKNRDSAEMVEKKLERVLTDAGTRATVGRFRETYLRGRSEDRVQDLVRSFLSPSRD